MGGNPLNLNEAQFAVLRWVADGCPDGVFRDYSHRVSAAALRTRGLVRVSGHGKTWRAEITDSGLSYLKGGSSDLRTGSQDGQEPQAVGSAAAEGAEQRVGSPRPLPPAEALIADLLENGGVLRVPYWRKEGEPDYQQRVLAAKRWGKVPPGKRLTTNIVRGELEIYLVDAPEGTAIDARPVPVPSRVSRPHAVAARYRDDSAHHQVSRAQISRCVRIVHALASECERRGYQMKNVERRAKREYGGRETSGNGDFTITIGGFAYPLKLSEEKVPTRGPWEAQERLRKTDYHLQRLGVEPRIGRYDKDATGRLTMRIDSGYSREGRQSSWGDRRSWKLEDKLPDLLREIEIRAVEDERRAQERRRQEEERQRSWEVAVERAKTEFAEDYRAKVLRAQFATWQEVRRLREYLAALEEEHASDPDAAKWIEWVRTFVSRLDPLSEPARMPDVPEPKPDDLKPFLGGLNPYGPRGW